MKITKNWWVGGSDDNASVYNEGDTLEDPLEKEMAIHSVLLPGKSHGRRSLINYSSWGRKKSDMTETSLSLSLSYFIKIKCAFSLRDIVKKMKTKAWDGKVYSSVCEYVSVHIQKDCI